MLKNAGGRFHFDLETGELVKPKKAAVRKAVNSVEDVVSDRDARMVRTCHAHLKQVLK